MASLARTVPSLARTVPSLARTVLKPSVLPQRGTRRQRQLVLTDGMDGMGWMGWDGMGWDGRSTFFFGPYLKNYYIIFLNYLRSFRYLFFHIF